MFSIVPRWNTTSPPWTSSSRDLVIGTTPVVQKAKQQAIPALYFTNLISARPLMGPAGAGSLATVINAALDSKPRFDEMCRFFDQVGSGYASGIWQDLPEDRPDFREKQRRRGQAAAAQKSTAEDPV